MSIRVMVAFSNDLFSEGVTRLLEDEDDFEADYISAGSEILDGDIESADVILTDFPTLYSSFLKLDPSTKNGFILLDTDCGKDNIISAIIARNLKGVLLSEASPAVLKKAIRSVASGDIWMDKATVKDLLWSVNRLKKDRGEVLSPKEKEIVALAGRGLRNREIADKLRISELTVKTHLHRIFKKLGITTRSQLINYSMRNPAAREALFTGK
ncbi:MAG: response regulator transcription factor [Thermodesulfobacteriota bacterium]|nr:MAG: response regulator transcription factor [Thermodesulfobacteriota bacterium]